MSLIMVGLTYWPPLSPITQLTPSLLFTLSVVSLSAELNGLLLEPLPFHPWSRSNNSQSYSTSRCSTSFPGCMSQGKWRKALQAIAVVDADIEV